MQLRTKRPHGRQRAPQQIDLFAEKPQNAIGSMPAWSQQRMTPISEPSACQDPKAPIGVAQARPRMPPLQHNQLLPQTKVFRD